MNTVPGIDFLIFKFQNLTKLYSWIFYQKLYIYIYTHTHNRNKITLSNSIRRWDFVNALIIYIYIYMYAYVCVCEWRWKLLNCVQLFVTPWIYSPWNSWDQNTGVGSPSILQGIVPTQGSNPGVLHCRRILYQLS